MEYDLLGLSLEGVAKTHKITYSFSSEDIVFEQASECPEHKNRAMRALSSFAMEFQPETTN